MPRRLLALAIAALSLATFAGCADDVSPAARIGDVKIGNDAFLAEVAEWAGNPAAVDQAMLGEDRSPGTYPLELARQLLQQRIDFELHKAEFEALGLRLDDALREHALIILFGDPAAAEEPFAAFSAEFARSYTDDVARQIAVADELGEIAYGEWRAQAYAETEIEVSPRYGTWNSENGEIDAPVGPTQPVEPAPSGF